MEFLPWQKCGISGVRGGDLPQRPDYESMGSVRSLPHYLSVRGPTRTPYDPIRFCNPQGETGCLPLSPPCNNFGKVDLPCPKTVTSPPCVPVRLGVMLRLFSADMRIQTWRRLWVALARAEHALGLPVTAEQVAELEAHVTDIDFDAAARREKEVRHDVMAHVYAYSLAAPSAAGIIHLGATSCYVTDNADLVLYREGLRYLRGELLSVMANLSRFARQYKATPTLGYTHYQPAQLVTVGKRATLWLQDFLSDLEELDFVLSHMKFLGCGAPPAPRPASWILWGTAPKSTR